MLCTACLGQDIPRPARISEWIINYDRLNAHRIEETAQGSIQTPKTYKRTTWGIKCLKSNLNGIFYYIKRSFIKIELKFDIWGWLSVLLTLSFCVCNILLFRNLFLIVLRFVLKVLPTYHRKICGIIIVMTVKIVNLLHTIHVYVQFYRMIYAHFKLFCAETGSEIEFMHKFSESVQFSPFLSFVFLTLHDCCKQFVCFVRFIGFWFLYPVLIFGPSGSNVFLSFWIDPGFWFWVLRTGESFEFWWIQKAGFKHSFFTQQILCAK